MSYFKCPGDSDSNHNLHSFKLRFVTEMRLSQPCRANRSRQWEKGPALSGAVWQPRELGYTSCAPQPPQRRPGRQGLPTEALRAPPSAALAIQLPPSRLRVPSAGSSASVQKSRSAAGETEQASSVLTVVETACCRSRQAGFPGFRPGSAGQSDRVFEY